MRLTDLSLNLLLALGTSTERDASLESLQGGGHDPRKRGITLQNLEFSIAGAVDPYFSAETHLIFFVDPIEGESIFEVEEAFLTTQQLPFHLEEHGLELELGQMFTEFGLLNPRHPHTWDWLDQPIINSRLFGPDGMRSPGVRLEWQTPLSWYSAVHVGMQNANGESMASFLASDEFFGERPIGGVGFEDREVRSLRDFVYLTRWQNAGSLSPEVSGKIGISGLIGPNASGADGQTIVAGGDLLIEWRPQREDSAPLVTWQTEVMQRDYEVDDQAALLPGEDLGDWGMYSQLLWSFHPNWAAGLRYEFVSGSGSSVGGRDADPFRDDRQRIAPLIAWEASHFSRVRFQYNYDQAEHLEDSAHSFWIGFEVMLGTHRQHETRR